MKASELMIGDWVQIDEPDKYAGAKGTICSLMHHHSDDGVYFHVFVQDMGIVMREVFNEDLRPIPLTAEILEKNGWYVPLLKSWWEHPDITFWMKRYTDGTFELMIDEGSDVSFCTIRFVHELQHALKLCGIDRTIEI